MNDPKTVLAFGEVLWDLLPGGAETLGGAPLNFAYRVNILGDRGVIVSRLGRDDYGRRAAAKIAKLGMDDRCLQWDDEALTGTVVVSFGNDGEPDYVIVPDVAYDRVEATPDVLAAAAEADCICFGTLAQRTAPAQAALAKILDACGKAPRLLDINLRKNCHTPASITESLAEATILKLNETEAAHLADLFQFSAELPEFCHEMVRVWSLSHCVVTLGTKGAFAVAEAAEPVYVPGYRVETVDPLGSGDAFLAGFVNRLLRGAPLGECLRLGNAAGALVATKAGGTAPIGRDEIDMFLRQPSVRTSEPSLESFAIA